MDLIEVPYVIDSQLYSHETHIRTPGLHLSHVIRSIDRDIRKMFRGDDLDDQDLEAYRAAGFLFEHALYDVLLNDPDIERLGEFEKDGIIFTPDAIRMSKSRLIESKMTWRSMPTRKNGKDIEGDFESWWVQMMAGCHGLGLTSAELWVMFANGGYGADRKPKIRRWEATFSKRELEQNWTRITKHAQWMRENGKVEVAK